MLSGAAQTRMSATRSVKQLTENLLLDDTNRAHNALVVAAAREAERNPVFAARIIMTYRLLPARRRKAKQQENKHGSEPISGVFSTGSYQEVSHA